MKNSGRIDPQIEILYAHSTTQTVETLHEKKSQNIKKTK